MNSRRVRLFDDTRIFNSSFVCPVRPLMSHELIFSPDPDIGYSSYLIANGRMLGDNSYRIFPKVFFLFPFRFRFSFSFHLANRWQTAHTYILTVKPNRLGSNGALQRPKWYAMCVCVYANGFGKSSGQLISFSNTKDLFYHLRNRFIWLLSRPFHFHFFSSFAVFSFCRLHHVNPFRVSNI